MKGLRVRGDAALFAELEERLFAAARAGTKLAGRTTVGGVPAFAKASPLHGKARWRHAARGWLLRRPPPRIREFDNLAWLRAAGFSAPRPLVAGAFLRSGLPSYQFLFTEEISRARTLREALPALPPERRPELVRTLARDVARLHARGFVHRDLFPRNLLVTGAGTRVWLLDAWRGGPGRGLRGPGYDLACLALYAPLLLGPEEEHELFSTYLAERLRLGEPARVPGLRRSVLRNRRALRARLARAPSREGGLEPPADWTAPF